MSVLAAALEAVDLGYAVVPLWPLTKKPAVKWKRWQVEFPTHADLLAWFVRHDRNLALVTTGLVVLDLDDLALFPWVVKRAGDTPYKVVTPSGGLHMGYRRPSGGAVKNWVRVAGLKIDVRTDGGLETLPPSRTPKGSYAWLATRLVAADRLPVACLDWVPPPKVNAAPVSDWRADDALGWRAERWLSRVPGAVAGERGHDRTFYAACRLVAAPPKGFGLTRDRALALLSRWNLDCKPEWTGRELEHKVDDALKKA